jgi:hypothetical protein
MNRREFIRKFAAATAAVSGAKLLPAAVAPVRAIPAAIPTTPIAVGEQFAREDMSFKIQTLVTQTCFSRSFIEDNVEDLDGLFRTLLAASSRTG